MEDFVIDIDSISFLDYNNGELFFKGIDDIYFGYKRYGFVIITRKFDRYFMEVLSKNVNREIIVIKDNKIINSTIYAGEKGISNLNIEFKTPWVGKTYFKEILINNKKMGFEFFPLIDYNGKIAAYIGTGFYYEEFENISKESKKMFIGFVVLFSILLLFSLYFIVNTLFNSFDNIMKGIKYISDGNYDKKIEGISLGEMGILADSINNLSNEIKRREEELKVLNQTLEEKVKSRTKELEMAYERIISAEKIDSLGRIIGGIAHELNSPLGGVLASTQMLKLDIAELKENEDLNSIMENIEIIEDGTKKVHSIILKLLKYTNTGNKNNFELVNIKEIVYNALALMKEKNLEPNIYIKLSIADDIFIKGNSIEIVKVILNILTNSKEALTKKITEDKKEISIFSYFDKNNVYLKIKDNGVGIEEENLTKIFEPFYTTKNVGEGMGLGLAITYDILKKYNASIEVVSKKNEYTEFTIKFLK